MTAFDTMLDLLDHGCDGEPRWIALDAADATAAASLARVVATEAERRGYVPVDAGRFSALARTLADEHRHRTFALLHMCTQGNRPDASVLVAAAVVNPRPHVLVTIAVASPSSIASALIPKRDVPFDPQRTTALAHGCRFGASPADSLVVREARSLYAPAAIEAAPAPLNPDTAKHVVRAECAGDLARSGRHEAALRLVRDAFGAVVRRRDARAAWHIGILLGRLLLDRGQPAAAERAFDEAATAVGDVPVSEAAIARVWLALARTDAGRLTDAESILRAIQVTGALEGAAARQWADAALARCLLWQNRVAEAVELVQSHAPCGHDADPLLVVNTLATHSRVLLAAGRTFDAGQRARAAIDRAERAADRLLRVVAETAHLRVLAAAGDVELVSAGTARLLGFAKELHAPLRALRVRVIWTEMLRRAGRSREADAEIRRFARLAPAAPPLLRRAIDHVAGTNPRVPMTAFRDETPLAVSLLRLAQDEDDDGVAAQRLLDYLAAHTRAARVELQSAAGGALTTLVSSGTGLAPRVGARAVEAGIVVGPENVAGAWELAAPIRAGHRLLGVIACRWPLGREPAAGVADHVGLGAAVVSPRVELLLAARTDAARAAVDVPELIGASAVMDEVRRAIGRAAHAPFAVIVEGESGAGKELVARAIHQLSARRDRPFCDVNCAALPDDLVESELFGHAKGAFTGALVERRGLFEEAHGGTLFLDELPDLSLRAQAKLLRVLQQNEIRRVGETFSRRVDVRLVTATNRAMGQEVLAGRFRQDLLYRLDVIRIRIPPLRERPEDVPPLAQHFWKTAAERAGTRAMLSHAVIAELSRYHWPGNVRELQNAMAALAVAAPSRGFVRATLLPPAITGAVAVSSARLADARRQFERRFIEVALARANGSRTRAAMQLGISRQGLLKLMTRLGIQSA